MEVGEEGDYIPIARLSPPQRPYGLKYLLATGSQDVHRDFHTAPELTFRFSVALHPQKP